VKLSIHVHAFVGDIVDKITVDSNDPHCSMILLISTIRQIYNVPILYDYVCFESYIYHHKCG